MPAVATPEGVGLALPSSTLNGRVVVVQTSRPPVDSSAHGPFRGHGTVRDSQVYFSFRPPPRSPLSMDVCMP